MSDVSNDIGVRTRRVYFLMLGVPPRLDSLFVEDRRDMAQTFLAHVQAGLGEGLRLCSIEVSGEIADLRVEEVESLSELVRGS